MKILNGVLLSVSASDLDKDGRFVNKTVKEVADKCFWDMPELTAVILPNCKKIGAYCFSYNQALTEVSLPTLITAGSDCFSYNQALTEVSLPTLITAGSYCFSSNQALTEVSLPTLITAGSYCFSSNQALTEVSLPALTTAGSYCFTSNQALTEVSLPVLTTAGSDCFSSNQALTEVSLPALTTAGSYCFRYNEALTEVEIGKKKLNVKHVDGYCFVVQRQRTAKGIVVYEGYNITNVEDSKIGMSPCYVAEKEGFTAHGDTVKSAISDVQFKIVAEKLKKEPIHADTIVSINHYRTITGACEFGCKSWLESNGLSGVTDMKASKLAPLLKKTDAYGYEKFMQLVQF